MARLNSWLLIPFPQLAIAHTATNHLSRPSGLDSKIVPTRDENCLRHDLHWSMLRLVIEPTLSLPHSQTIFPPGHLIERMYVSATFGSAK